MRVVGAQHQPYKLGLIRLRHESLGGSVLWRTLADAVPVFEYGKSRRTYGQYNS
jgi:hypothetical protein